MTLLPLPDAESRRAKRKGMGMQWRTALLEDDMDLVALALERMDKKLSRLLQVAVGILVSVNTALIVELVRLR